jgi:hypothetical protein
MVGGLAVMATGAPELPTVCEMFTVHEVPEPAVRTVLAETPAPEIP